MKKLGITLGLILGVISLSISQSEIRIRKNTSGLTLFEMINNQDNVFIGQNSGLSTTIGTYNTTVGNTSMQNNTLGSFNTALGQSSLFLNTEGNNNVAIGYASISNGLLGSNNVAIGNFALQESKNNNNTAVGYKAGQKTESYSNTYLGAESGQYNTGGYNVFLGAFSGQNEAGSHKLIIENTDADSTAALIYGEFDTDKLRLNAEVNINGNYTLPTTAGAESQVMSINSAGQAVWDSLLLMDQDSTNELIQLVGTSNDTIVIADAGGFHTIDLKVTKLSDTDEDTRIILNKDNLDEDKIRFEIDGTEKLVLSNNADGQLLMEFENNENNTYIGKNAGINSVSNYNVFIGSNAGKDNTIGAKNTYLGGLAGERGISSASNTIIGHKAGTKNNGNYNTFIGENAGHEHITGHQNTFIGEQSGKFNQGDRNVALGSEAGKFATGDRNVLLGAEAGTNSNGGNKLYIENSDADSTAALIYGEFDNDKLWLNGEVNVNGDYSLPTDTAALNQFMIMGADGKLKWYSEQVKQTGVEAQWGRINTHEEVYTGSDTIFRTWTSYIHTPLITDQDYDTKIEVQDIDGADQDKIDMTIDGTLRYTIKDTGLGMSVIEQHNNNENIFIGRDAGQTSTGGKNTFVGYKAGEDVLNGEYNTYLGKSAGQSAKGGYNVTVGEYSGANVKGDYNTTLGVNSGRSIEGDRNLVLGEGAARNAKGNDNVFIGSRAGYSANSDNKLYIENTDADSTAALIYGEFDTNKLRLNAEVNINEKMIIQQNASDELQISIPTIYRNIFLGDQSGDANTPSAILGQDNVFIGDQTGKSNTEGYGNTFIGSAAGSAVATGIHNSFIGSYAGQNNNGSSNTFIGNNSGLSNVTGNGNIFIGDKSGSNETGSNKLYISNDDHDQDNALIYGEFDTEKLRINGDLGIGTNPGFPIHINQNNSRIKQASLLNSGVITSASDQYWQVRLSATSNAESLGIDMTEETFEPYQNDTLTLGSAAYKWKEIYATNATINTSDLRFKKNINDINYGLETVMQMRPVSYQWKKEKNGRTINGFIAQEMEEIVPEVVHISEVTPNANKPGTESEYSELYGMRYTELIPVLTKAIQDQQALIEALTERIEALEKK